MSYPGGKAGPGVYQRIINQIPPHDVYVEPFLGDGAVMRRKRAADRNIGIELEPGVAAAFEGTADGNHSMDPAAGFRPEIYNCCGIDWMRFAFGLHRVDRLSRNGSASAGDSRSIVSGSDDAAGCVAAVSSRNTRSRWFVYCDPPYLMSTRRSGPLYRHEMTDDQHVELLTVIKLLPCMVMISGYCSPLYSDALQGWRTISFETTTRGNTLATEWLWMNYPEPTELHDYQFLGDEKRERERVSRKVRNWSEGLQRLPVLERLAILDAITGRRNSRRFLEDAK